MKRLLFILTVLSSPVVFGAAAAEAGCCREERIACREERREERIEERRRCLDELREERRRKFDELRNCREERRQSRVCRT